MAAIDYYASLGVSKGATDAEIKKAYKKLAMQHHPDRNKNDKKAEAKFKEVNEAYQTLGDPGKRKEYDQFGSGDFSKHMGGRDPFSGAGSTQGFSGFEDIFSQFGAQNRRRGTQSEHFEFDLGDIFGHAPEPSRSSRSRQHNEPSPPPKEAENLDVTKVVEIPFLDFLFDTTVSVETVYSKHLTLKVKAGTKPGTKFKLTGKGRSSNGKTGDMFVIVDAKMPKDLSPQVMKMLEAVRYQI